MPVCASRFCSGVSRSKLSLSISAILPVSVPAPVSVTMASALPVSVCVPEYSIFCLCARGVPCASVLRFFSIGMDSPVSEASFTVSPIQSKIRQSAGTISPCDTFIISPRTSSRAGSSVSMPPRIALAVRGLLFFSASMAFSALHSCITPTAALKSTMAIIISGSEKSPRPL